MLTRLLIKNFTITEKVDIEWQSGMTTITGETGAGKSIMLNALKIVLGDKASPEKIKQDAEKCEITAVFDLSTSPKTLKLLKELDLDDEENPNELVIRRVITRSGSKSYINDLSVKIPAIKSITKDLIDIHSQSEHHNLLNKEHQLTLLDEYSNVLALKYDVALKAKIIKDKEHQINMLINNKDANNHKIELLNYQLKELEELNLKEGEVEELEEIFNKMENSTYYKQSISSAIDGLFESENSIIDQLGKIQSDIPEMEELKNVSELVGQAIISLDETRGDLHHALDSLDINEDDWLQIQERMNQVNMLTKKHKVLPEDLFNLRKEIEANLAELDVSDDDIVALREEVEVIKKEYHFSAKKLSSSRNQAARYLSEKVSSNIEKLKISANAFRVEVNTHGIEDETIDVNGYETIEFMFCPNPGNPFGSLSKIASGGELSRVSLAIQLALAEVAKFNTLMFDEVDVGIGGSTAAVVGTMLKKLGSNGQVICITHQPQVASQGHNHLQVFKNVVDENTYHGMKYLNMEDRVKEVARMLSSHEITESTLQLAKDMLKN